MERDPSKRLGAGLEGSAEIKRHPFFREIDWRAVAQRELKPPKPRFNLSVSKKNIPKDLLSEEEDGKNYILGWSFFGDAD